MPDLSVRRVSSSRCAEALMWELGMWQAALRRRWWPVVAPSLSALNWRRVGRRLEPLVEGPLRRLRLPPLRPRDVHRARLRAVHEHEADPRGATASRVVCSDPLADSYVTFRGRWLAEADLVVMINVLDHVRDADACMRTAVDLLRPGGYFVLGLDLSNEVDVAQHPYDVGHPIRLRREDLEPYLSSLTTVHRKDLARDEGRDPRLHYATLVYAGRKPR